MLCTRMQPDQGPAPLLHPAQAGCSASKTCSWSLKAWFNVPFYSICFVFLTKVSQLPLDNINFSTTQGASGSFQPVKERGKKTHHENNISIVSNQARAKIRKNRSVCGCVNQQRINIHLLLSKASRGLQLALSLPCPALVLAASLPCRAQSVVSTELYRCHLLCANTSAAFSTVKH